MKVYTIGYGSNTKEEFLQALNDNEIGVLIDVRSSPYSKWQKWTNKLDFKEWLNDNGIVYVHRPEMGGKPLASDKQMLIGLNKIEKAYEKAKDQLDGKNVTVMCSEADPDRCHRKTSIARVGEENGFEFEHILVSEKLKNEEQLEKIKMTFDF